MTNFTSLFSRAEHLLGKGCATKLDWEPWLRRLFGALGVTLLLAGAITFVAFNWAAMPGWSKLALGEAGFVICLAGVWKFGFDTFAGRLCVCAASVCVGLFLAVFGQIYQTGANTWQLFAAWAALISLWTALSRFAAQWALLLILLNITLVLYFPVHFHISPRPFLWGMGLNGAALIARELAAGRVAGWLSSRWTRLLPLTLLLVAAAPPVCIAILNEKQGVWLPAAAAGLACLLGSLCFCWRKGELAGTTLVVCSGFPIINIFAVSRFQWSSAMIFYVLFLALINIGYVCFTASLPRRLAQRATPEAAGAPRIRCGADTPHGGEPRQRKYSLGGLIVAGLGGLIAAPCLAFILMPATPEELLGPLISGGAACAVAAFLGKRNKENGVNATLTFSLALLLAGWGLCAIGFAQLDSPELALVGLTLLSLVAYLGFPHALPRFSLVILWQSAVFLLAGAKATAFPSLPDAFPALPNIFQLAALALPLLNTAALPTLALRRTLSPRLFPACYAGICILIAQTLYTQQGQRPGPDFLWASPPFPATVIAWILVITLLIVVRAQHEAKEESGAILASGHMQACRPYPVYARLNSLRMIFGCLLLIGLVVLGAPGILLSLTLLIVGRARGFAALSVLGFLFLPWFLFDFYYSLHMSLALKSLALSASGLFLLLAAVCLGETRKETRPCA